MHRWRLASASDPHLAGRATYPLERCDVCASARTLDVDATPPQVYEAGTYSDERRVATPLLEPLRRLADRDRLRFVDAVPKGARVLELGAGDGKFVNALAAAGYRSRGIEPSPRASRAATRIGADVVNATVESAEVDAGSQDAVIAWHALEHLADPAAAITRAREWLVPGGRLIVAVPDLASLQARIGGDRWFHQDVPRHRTHFTSRGLGELLERSGLHVTRVRHILVEQNPLGMWLTLLNRVTVERDFFFRLVKGDLGGVSRSATSARSARNSHRRAAVGPGRPPARARCRRREAWRFDRR